MMLCDLEMNLNVAEEGERELENAVVVVVAGRQRRHKSDH